MAENMMNKEHKASNEAYREGWDRIFIKESNKDRDAKKDTKDR